VWLSAVGAKRWAVISKDKRIRYRGAERAAVWSARVALFIFRAGNMRGDEIARIIAGALPKMLGVLQIHPPPFIATISKAGSVKVIAV
jgi:hypothetical protein